MGGGSSSSVKSQGVMSVPRGEKTRRVETYFCLGGSLGGGGAGGGAGGGKGVVRLRRGDWGKRV